MFGLRSLRNRLAVVFGLIVLGAIGTIYLTVTPRLEERLQGQKLDRLQADARRYVEGRGGWAADYRGEDEVAPLELAVLLVRQRQAADGAGDADEAVGRAVFLAGEGVGAADG